MFLVQQRCIAVCIAATAPSSGNLGDNENKATNKIEQEAKVI